MRARTTKIVAFCPGTRTYLHASTSGALANRVRKLAELGSRMKAFTRRVDETNLTPNESQSWYYTQSQTNSSSHFSDDRPFYLSSRRRYLVEALMSERMVDQPDRLLGDIERRMGDRFRCQPDSDW